MAHSNTVNPKFYRIFPNQGLVFRQISACPFPIWLCIGPCTGGSTLPIQRTDPDFTKNIDIFPGAAEQFLKGDCIIAIPKNHVATRGCSTVIVGSQPGSLFAEFKPNHGILTGLCRILNDDHHFIGIDLPGQRQHIERILIRCSASVRPADKTVCIIQRYGSVGWVIKLKRFIVIPALDIFRYKDVGTIGLGENCT